MNELEEITEFLNKDKRKKCICGNCKKEIYWQHKHRPDTCPHCGDQYFNKPEDERSLFVIQDEWLKTRDKEVLGKMYKILVPYVRKLIVQRVKGKYFFTVEELEIKTHDVCSDFIYYYLSVPEFKMLFSFGGYIKRSLLSVLFGDKEEERNHDSLNSMIDIDQELDDYLPQISLEAKYKMYSEFNSDNIDNNSEYIIKNLSEQINKIADTIQKNFSIKESLLFLVGIKNKLEGQTPEFMEDFYAYAGETVQTNLKKALLLIYRFLKWSEL
jgi:hypothetical protein